MVLAEFQAVVLAAGRGTRLPELMNECPKCLLPIGPYPMLWYPLQMLHRHGFPEAIVVVFESQKAEIQQLLDKTPLKIKIEYATIPTDSDFGTADSLRYIHDRITTNVIVVPCDAITNADLYPVASSFRAYNAAVATLLFSGSFDSSVTVPGPKAKHKPERDLIGIHPDTDRLLFLASTSDFEEEFQISGHLLRKNAKMVMHSRLVDSHIYFMKKWVIDYLTKKESFSTLKGEFLPHIIKKQMARSTQPTHIEATSEVAVNIKPDEDIFSFIPYDILEEKMEEASHYNDSVYKPSYGGDVIRCYAVQAPKDRVGVRINTTLSYYAANLKIAYLWKQLFPNNDYPLISPNAIVESTQAKNIAVADNAKLSPKTSLTLTTFGAGCVINPKVIITHSVIMANAVIEEGCKINNSIICNRAVIKKGSVIKNCLIGPNFVVEEESDLDMLHLTNADGFMEIE